MTVINQKSISGINSITTGSGTDNLLTIHNNSGAERFRIDGSGNTRITSGIVTTVSVGAVTGDISIDDKIIHTGDTNTALRFPTTDTISFETGGSEALRIDSSQRVVIGATSQRSVWGGQQKLSIEGTDGPTSSAHIVRNSNDSSYPYIALGKSRGTSDGSSTIVQHQDVTGVITFNGADGGDMNPQTAEIRSEVDGTPGTNDMPGRLCFYTTADGAYAAQERVRINSVGKVGINSTAPDGMLAIEHTSSAPNLTMRNHPAAGPYTNEYGLELRHAFGSVKHGALIHTQEAADSRRALDVSDSNGVFATFTNGKVGVGTITPTEKLEVHNSSGTTLIKASVNGNSRVGLEIQKTGSTTQTWRIQDGQSGNGILEFYDQTDSRSVMTLGGTGNVTIGAGNVIMGTAGKGIDFAATSGPDTGASANTELLSDYEEGSWDGALMDGNSSNVTTSNKTAYYVKVGKLVYCYFNITPNDSGKSGVMQLYRIPYTTHNTTIQAVGTWWLDKGGYASGDAIGGVVYMPANENRALFVYPTTTWQQASQRYVQFSEWPSGRPMYGSFTYYAQD